MKIRLGEKDVDLSKALPIRMGDIKKLKKEHGFGLKDLGTLDEEKTMAIVLVLAQKVDPSVTMEDVDTIQLTMLVTIIQFLNEAQQPETTDVPT